MLLSVKLLLNSCMNGLIVYELLLFLYLLSSSVEWFLMLCRFMLLLSVVFIGWLLLVIVSMIFGFGLFYIDMGSSLMFVLKLIVDIGCVLENILVFGLMLIFMYCDYVLWCLSFVFRCSVVFELGMIFDRLVLMVVVMVLCILCVLVGLLLVCFLIMCLIRLMVNVMLYVLIVCMLYGVSRCVVLGVLLSVVCSSGLMWFSDFLMVVCVMVIVLGWLNRFVVVGMVCVMLNILLLCMVMMFGFVWVLLCC